MKVVLYFLYRDIDGYRDEFNVPSVDEDVLCFNGQRTIKVQSLFYTQISDVNKITSKGLHVESHCLLTERCFSLKTLSLSVPYDY